MAENLIFADYSIFFSRVLLSGVALDETESTE
jgi:hypothetical protein